MFTPEGVDIFMQCANRSAADFVTRNQICSAMQELLDKKALVESCAVSVVRMLQVQKCCWVFILTSRYSDTALQTQAALAQMGLDFTLCSPLPCGQALQDPQT